MRAGGPPSTGVAGDVRVWDLLQRLLHWSLVAALVVTWLTGEATLQTHLAAGYVALAVLVLRLVWGVVGSTHARFSGFVPGPRRAWAYWRELRAGRAARYLGHNPLGGWMIVAMLACLAVACASGVAYTTDRFWGVAWVEAVHRVSAWSLLGLVVLHVAGVVAMSLHHGENLVRAMITGRKARTLARRQRHAGR